MKKYRLSIGNASAVICNYYDEAVKIAKPFAEKMVPIYITPINVAKAHDVNNADIAKKGEGK